MADTDVGKRAVLHTDDGDLICWVLEYEAGRDSGDHYVAGWNNSKSKVGQADYFSKWVVVGDDAGEITILH